MAEPLVNQYGPEVPRRVADMLHAVWPLFDVDAFMADVLQGYAALDLMARGRHMALALRRHLPSDVEMGMDLLVASAGQVDKGEGSLASFLFLPHTCFVAEFGLAHFEAAMRAQHALTQVFTAEFSIRPFLEQHPEATLERLASWVIDPSAHVRRLVSEGTRPRLPWGRRLRAFQLDPRPVLALLERLKDDPELYVRRSVANNLNDIGKDHPDVLVATARRWLKENDEHPGRFPHRRWVVEHALRSLIKAGHPEALAALGFGERACVELLVPCVCPPQPAIGESVELVFSLRNPNLLEQNLRVDLGVHYVKANGSTRLKVFMLKSVCLAPQGTVAFRKKLALTQMTTRVHYPGVHRVEVRINGQPLPLGDFDLQVG